MNYIIGPTTFKLCGVDVASQLQRTLALTSEKQIHLHHMAQDQGLFFEVDEVSTRDVSFLSPAWFQCFPTQTQLIYTKYELQGPKQSHEEAAVPGQTRPLAMLSTKAVLPTVDSRDRLGSLII